MACAHCNETTWHKNGCIAMLAAISAARRVSPDPPPAASAASAAPRFAAIKASVLQGSTTVARAASKTMAKRIANALNKYKPNKEGV